MKETNLNLPEASRRLLTLPRGKERHKSHFHIIMAILDLAWPACPTRDQLQVLSRIRRKRFIAVLRYLVDTGAVIKFGEGTKRNGPFRYRLADEHRTPKF